MDKAPLRQQTIQALAQLPAEQRQQASQQLYRQLFARPEWHAAQVVATTLSSAIELDTAPIIAAARAAQKTVVVPQTLPHRQMAFRVLTAATTVVTTKFGIREPQDNLILNPRALDLIVVPGLKFAASGERLGFGGGYYDRYLPRTTGFKVALALPAQQAATPSWPVEDFDVRLDAVLNSVNV